MKLVITATSEYSSKNGAPLYRLVEPLEFIGYTVPVGFKTNLASTPRWMWWYWPPHDSKIAAPAALHDYLISRKTDKKLAAFVFHDALIASGMSKTWAKIMSWWVR